MLTPSGISPSLLRRGTLHGNLRGLFIIRQQALGNRKCKGWRPSERFQSFHCRTERVQNVQGYRRFLELLAV